MVNISKFYIIGRRKRSSEIELPKNKSADKSINPPSATNNTLPAISVDTSQPPPIRPPTTNPMMPPPNQMQMMPPAFTMPRKFFILLI